MKSFFIIAAILFVTNSIYAQQKASGVPGQNAAGSLTFSGLVHDFGKIKQNIPVPYTFEFTNSGKEPLLITNAKPSCSCTVSEYTKDPVLPGEKGMVKVIYNAHNPGTFSKTVTVTSDKGETIVLNISGEVTQ